MRRYKLAILVFCLFCLLTACSRAYISNKDKIIRDYTKNEALFNQCAAEIKEHYISKYGEWYQIKADQDGHGLIAKKVYIGDEEWSALDEIEASQLPDLFQITKVNLIFGREQCIYFREFSTGMGSTTSAGICYIPSGNIQDLLEYSNKMQFEVYNEGYLGTIPDSDNYLYYQQLSPNFFFYEYGD